MERRSRTGFGVSQPGILWRTSWEVAANEAREQNRLLFVLFSCARPSKLRDEVLNPTDPALCRLLLETVIPVRFTSLKGVDLNLFRFDYDLALVGLVMTPSGAILARWGGEDSSLSQLVSVLNRVRPPIASVARVARPMDLLQKYPRFAKQKAASQPCYHCHYANDAEIQERQASGTFTKAMLFRFPPAKTLGMTLNPTTGNEVAKLAADSVSARAGVRQGDLLEAANGIPIYTEADLSFVLDRLPDLGSTLLLQVKRGRATQTLTLNLPSGWRTYDISWRPSQGAIPPILGFWEDPVPGSKTLALKITILFPGEKWRASQGELRVGDVIVAVDGKTLPALSARQFHSWFRLNKQVGETARFTVLRGGRRLELPIPCLDLRLD